MGNENVLWVPPLTRQPMFSPGQLGVHGSDNFEGLRMDANGAVFYVDPNHADTSDDHDGTDPDHPLTTVAEALTRVRAYKNDVIAVMHNSFWTYANASAGRNTAISEAVIVTTPGIRIVGIAPGSLGVPWVAGANAATCITVRAMDVTIEGFCFWPSSYTTTNGIICEWNAPTYYGESTVIRNNYFYDLNYGIILDYTYNMRIENNFFDGIDVADIFNRSTYGDCDQVIIKNNVFMNGATAISVAAADSFVVEGNRFHNYSTAAISMTSSDDSVIHGNTIFAAAAGTNNMINLSGVGGDGNLVSDNWLSCSIAQYDTTCSPSAGTDAWVNNHCINGDPVANPT